MICFKVRFPSFTDFVYSAARFPALRPKTLLILLIYCIDARSVPFLRTFFERRPQGLLYFSSLRLREDWTGEFCPERERVTQEELKEERLAHELKKGRNAADLLLYQFWKEWTYVPEKKDESFDRPMQHVEKKGVTSAEDAGWKLDEVPAENFKYREEMEKLQRNRLVDFFGKDCYVRNHADSNQEGNQGFPPRRIILKLLFIPAVMVQRSRQEIDHCPDKERQGR